MDRELLPAEESVSRPLTRTALLVCYAFTFSAVAAVSVLWAVGALPDGVYGTVLSGAIGGVCSVVAAVGRG